MPTLTNSNDSQPAFLWQRAGEIRLCSKGKPEFPSLNPGPGLYRITLPDGRSYIGEASDLAHRMSEYRTPTGIEQERWICECLKKACGGFLDVMLGNHFGDKSIRNQIERNEIAKAVEQGMELLNGQHDRTVERIRHKIEFHERHLTRLKNLLDTLESEVRSND
ncbi:MAG: hypothetical protein JST61_01540 [Acidobacteria bacterium]|nr:hypothetical protein [Acidobacteriota bacterium]